MKIFICDISPDRACRHTTLLSDSAMTRLGVPVFLPDFTDRWEGRVMPAIRISRLGLAIRPEFASRYFDAVTLVHQLMPQGVTLPADALATTFDGALAPGRWAELSEDTPMPQSMSYGDNSLMLTDLHSLACSAIVHISRNITLRNGDIIALSHYNLPVVPVSDSKVVAALGPDSLLDFKFK